MMALKDSDLAGPSGHIPESLTINCFFSDVLTLLTQLVKVCHFYLYPFSLSTIKGCFPLIQMPHLLPWFTF